MKKTKDDVRDLKLIHEKQARDEKAKNGLRDRFIKAKAAKFSPSEIQVLMEREGFKVVSRIRIMQIAGTAKPKTHAKN